MIKGTYKDQVQLLLRILPYFMREPKFALKGGTAINLFYQDMPRLSVDIDLTYVPLEDRSTSFATMNTSFERILKDVTIRFPSLRIQPVNTGEGNTKQIIFRDQSATIKVEINHILRGVVHPCKTLTLCPSAQEAFGVFVTAQCVSREDLYAGKICAALDRQHPRDLFDIHMFLAKDKLDDTLRKTFIVYLISNNRPISELINPNRLDMRRVHENEFEGMSLTSLSYETLEETRETLIHQISADLTSHERQFLLSFKIGKPEWDLLGVKGIECFPAVQWKLQNIHKMSPQKHNIALEELKRKLTV